MMVIFESHFTSYLYRRKPETGLLGALGSAARWVLILYLVLRFGDLAVRGQLHYLAGGEWQVKVFWLEIAVMAIIPLVLLSMPQFQRQGSWQWATAALGVSGVVLNRIDVGGLVALSRGNRLYLPEWTEIAVSLAIVAAATLVFLFMIEHFKVWEKRPADPEADPRKLPEFGEVDSTWLGVPRHRCSHQVLAGFYHYRGRWVFLPGQSARREPGRGSHSGSPRSWRRGALCRRQPGWLWRHLLSSERDRA